MDGSRVNFNFLRTVCIPLSSSLSYSNQSKTFVTGEYYYLVININILLSAGGEMQWPKWDGWMLHL